MYGIMVSVVVVIAIRIKGICQSCGRHTFIVDLESGSGCTESSHSGHTKLRWMYSVVVVWSHGGCTESR